MMILKRRTFYTTAAMVILSGILLVKCIFDLIIYIENFDSRPVPNHIWVYWENPPGTTQPGYITLCLQTILKHNRDQFNIHILDEHSIHQYLPNLRNDLADKLNIAQQADYYRVALLYQYGGIWLDADTIVFRSLAPILDYLKHSEFVGFGCHFSDKICMKHGGHPLPSNWVMAARRHSKLFLAYMQEMDATIDTHDKAYFEKGYHALGWALLAKQIGKFTTRSIGWHYTHMPSKCTEFDSRGHRITDDILLEDHDIDAACKDKYLFVPIYNGTFHAVNNIISFPQWFKAMPPDAILQKKYLISKLFAYALR